VEYPDRLATLLDEIEAEMRRLGLWEGASPPRRAFHSPNPFCYDTMAVTQWMQWVFIPRMRETLAMGVPLAAPCEVTPALEVHFDELGGERGRLIGLVAEFDRLMPDPVTC